MQQFASDRTGEYSQIVKSLSTSTRKARPHPSSSRNRSFQQHAQFTNAARLISHDLSKAFTKVEKLALLAKKQSLFEDRGPEIQELTYIIKQDIASLSQQVVDLQSLARSQNGTSSQTTRHSHSVVQGLGSHLGKMRNQFESLLKSHWEALRKQEERRGHILGAPINAQNGHSSKESPRKSTHSDDNPMEKNVVPSRLLKDEMRANNWQGDSREFLDANHSTVIDMNQTQQQMILLQDHTDTYMQSRAEAMSNIESTIHELGRIFAQVATMVREQEESVILIDSNVDTMQSNVENAHSELVRYFQSVTSNRWLMAKVCGVLLVFFIIFVVLFA